MRKVKPIIHHHHIEIRRRGGGNTCSGTHEVLSYVHKIFSNGSSFTGNGMQMAFIILESPLLFIHVPIAYVCIWVSQQYEKFTEKTLHKRMPVKSLRCIVELASCKGGKTFLLMHNRTQH